MQAVLAPGALHLGAGMFGSARCPFERILPLGPEVRVRSCYYSPPQSATSPTDENPV